MSSANPDHLSARSEVDRMPQPPRKKSSCLGWLVLVGLLGVLVLAGVIALVMQPVASPAPLVQPRPTVQTVVASTGILAIAFSVNPDAPLLSAYIGNPVNAPFTLPKGKYYIEAVDQNNFVIALSNQVVAAPNDRVVLPNSFQQAGGVQDAARARSLKTLANGLARIELTKLVALQAASGNFSVPLFDAQTRPTQADLDRLFAQYIVLGAQQNDVLAALASIEPRASAAFPRQVASRNAMPALGVFDKIKTQLTGFFGYAGDAGKRAGERILATSAQLSPDDKQDAFDSIRPGLRGDARNYDELIEKIKAGALDTQATQIEADLRNSPGYIVVAQQKNQTVGEIVRQEGAELVIKGGELQAQVIKTVLADVFPDITTGFDYADKVKDWVEYINQVYQDPLGVVGGKLSDTAKEKIKERIQSDLEKCCGQLSDKIREQIADKVSDTTITTITDAFASGTVTPAAKPGTTTVAQANQTPSSTPTALVLPTRTPTATGTPTSSPTPSVTPSTTPNVTPTPDLSWIDPYVQNLANQMMLALINPIQVAIVTEDLRA